MKMCILLDNFDFDFTIFLWQKMRYLLKIHGKFKTLESNLKSFRLAINVKLLFKRVMVLKFKITKVIEATNKVG